MAGRSAVWFSALGSGPRGRRFKSSRPDQIKLFPKLEAFCCSSTTPHPRSDCCFFLAELEAVLCKAKYAAKEDVTLTLNHQCSGNSKELPKFLLLEF